MKISNIDVDAALANVRQQLQADTTVAPSMRTAIELLIVLGIITMGFISFGLWVHHMFTVDIPQLAQAFFSMASMLVAIPTAIQIFAWLATLWQGKVVFHLPMLWIVGFLVVFVCGGLNGVIQPFWVYTLGVFWLSFAVFLLLPMAWGAQ